MRYCVSHACVINREFGNYLREFFELKDFQRRMKNWQIQTEGLERAYRVCAANGDGGSVEVVV